MAALTARDLLNSGAKPQTPAERLRSEALRIIDALRARGMEDEMVFQALFPRTILPRDTLDTLITALLAGSNTLLFGPPGSGKTSLAKDIWELYPKKIAAVADCPVQDDPMSLVDEQYSVRVPPCPFCRMKYGGVAYGELRSFQAKEVDPSKVPVKEGVLREGHGFARLQGSSEVFPDNLTGTINLHKLQEVGDPTNPLVLEPGKLLQANRGLLVVDEIGKLPLGTQNVLLQALQESTVSPAKTRETFPASFVAVCTSNLSDLDNINEPLADRLQNVYIGFNRQHSKNRLIVELALSSRPVPSFFPSLLIESAIYIVEEWRRSTGEIFELSEVGSNRTMIDIIMRSEAYAVLAGKNSGGVNVDNLKRGTLDAMQGHIRARSGDSYSQDEKTIQEFLKKQFGEAMHRAGLEYWCTFFTETLRRDKSETRRVLDDCKSAVKAPSPDRTKFPKFSKFVEYSVQRERHRGQTGETEAAAAAFRLLQEMDVFECDEKK